MGRARDLAALLEQGLDGRITEANALASMAAGNFDWGFSGAEDYSTVPIGTGSQSFWRAINHIDVPDVRAGDQFLVFAQGQIREEVNVWVECAPLITWTDGLTNTAHNLSGHELFKTYIVGSNVKQTSGHYFPWVRLGFHQFQESHAAIRIFNNLRCRSSDAAIDGTGNQVVTVNTGQTGLFWMRLNKRN